MEVLRYVQQESYLAFRKSGMCTDYRIMGEHHRTSCSFQTVQIITKKARRLFTSETETPHCVTGHSRLGKTRGAVNVQTVVALAGVTGTKRNRAEPPALDVRTRWTLTRQKLLVL
jgi:hypothetical protein